jgi:hypothetical protein
VRAVAAITCTNITHCGQTTDLGLVLTIRHCWQHAGETVANTCTVPQGLCGAYSCDCPGDQWVRDSLVCDRVRQVA